MNKLELAESIQEEIGGSRAQAERVVAKIFEQVIDVVAKGEEVSIAGFGVFEARKRAARMGRNPKTGEALKIAASRVPKFRAGKAFKDMVK